jgi:hypothetical protein
MLQSFNCGSIVPFLLMLQAASAAAEGRMLELENERDAAQQQVSADQPLPFSLICISVCTGDTGLWCMFHCCYSAPWRLVMPSFVRLLRAT